ncbi:EthD family reductase [Rhodococcus opacus]|uniref:Ethyl tert-butyl ether degradation protein EthD n=1 Tax=Rhodococcus opacus TaxID=37919 RepID=A0A076EY58_RHOOP|nr:EthD family reductase [Rhodococcus opacus]AII10870.1 ethyl tert-butyl ether degradation protein EthD [Rhodococcus opacus]
MYTLMVLYGNTDQPQHFREYYENTHLPIARKLPGVRNTRLSLDISSAEGTSPYCAVFEADFDSAEDMGAALASPEGQAAQQDIPNFATGGVQILHFPARTA